MNPSLQPLRSSRHYWCLVLSGLIFATAQAEPKKQPTTDPSTMATGSPFEQKTATLPKESSFGNKSAELQKKSFATKSSTFAKPAQGLDKNYSLPSSSFADRTSTLGGKNSTGFDRDFKLRGSFEPTDRQPFVDDMKAPDDFLKKSKLEKPYQGKLPGAVEKSKKEMADLQEKTTKQLSPDEVQEILNKN